MKFEKLISIYLKIYDVKWALPLSNKPPFLGPKIKSAPPPPPPRLLWSLIGVIFNKLFL